MLLLLPWPPRRAWLQSFCLAMSLVVALTVGVVLGAAVSGTAGWMGAGLALAAAVPGLFRPELVRPLYARWNAAARLVARAVSAILRRLFFGVLAAAGRVGPSLALERPAGSRSLWISRSQPSPAGYFQQHAARQSRPPATGWLAYLGWAVEGGHWWAVSLLPYVALLRAFEVRPHAGGVPSQNYTLY